VGCCLGRMVAGGDYIIEIEPDKKIVHVDKMGYSENTTILEVLQTMPELLERRSADGSLLSNFSIQIDDRSVGQSRDVVLSQTLIAEVDAIEISTSPTVSEQKNGTGGVINIIMKPIQENGASGMVMLDASTEWNVAPSVLVNYRKDNFTLRSSFQAEYYRPTDRGYSYLYGPDTLMESNDTTWRSYKQETAKLYMEYKPTDRDALKVSVWESYAREHHWSDMQTMLMRAQPSGSDNYRKYERQDTGDGSQEALTAEAFMKYVHNYSTHEGELNIEAQYSYMPTRSDQADFQSAVKGTFGGDTWTRTRKYEYAHQVQGEANSKHVVWQREKDYVDLKYGVNASYMFGPKYEALEKTLLNRIVESDTVETGNASIYASPYTEMNFRLGIWSVRAGVRYQYYRVNLNDNRTDKNYTDNHTFTSNVSLRCDVSKDHHLRLNLARNISREVGLDDISIYPYYDADLNYIFEWKNTEHSVLMCVGADYIYAKQYVGYTGTACVNAQLIYQYSIFSMAFAGNAYVRTQYKNELAGKHHWYFNLSLLPVLSLRKQWTLSGKLVYNSKIRDWEVEYGDCFYSQIRVAKQIRGWNIHLELDDIFDYVTYNTLYSLNGTEYKNLDDLYPRCLKVGFSYTF